jgi:hypothetical protein
MSEPMKTKLIVLVLAIVLIIGGTTSTRAEPPSQVPPLPADLLFTTNLTAEWLALPRNVIARVDAETLEVTPFYTDTEAYEVVPLSWSPQGDLLAVYRILPPIDESLTLFPRQLCILDRAGELQRCMDDGLPMYGMDQPQYWGDYSYSPVTWSPDGQNIYFDIEYPNAESFSGYGRRLVEASVMTGQTLRVIYDYPGAFSISLSPDMNHVAVGFGGEWYGIGFPAYTLDLTTGTQIDIPALLPEDVGLYLLYSFSPQGNYYTVGAGYLTAYHAPELEQLYEAGDLLLILDPQGNIQHVVGEPEGPDPLVWRLESPTWQADEQAIVLYGYRSEHRYLMRYSLSDQELTALYELGWTVGHEPYIDAPFVSSPDNTHIALTVSDDPYGDRQVAVLYPDGEIRRIPSPYRFGLYPLWVPNE